MRGCERRSSLSEPRSFRCSGLSALIRAANRIRRARILTRPGIPNDGGGFHEIRCSCTVGCHRRHGGGLRLPRLLGHPSRPLTVVLPIPAPCTWSGTFIDPLPGSTLRWADDAALSMSSPAIVFGAAGARTVPSLDSCLSAWRVCRPGRGTPNVSSAKAAMQEMKRPECGVGTDGWCDHCGVVGDRSVCVDAVVPDLGAGVPRLVDLRDLGTDGARTRHRRSLETDQQPQRSSIRPLGDVSVRRGFGGEWSPNPLRVVRRRVPTRSPRTT